MQSISFKPNREKNITNRAEQPQKMVRGLEFRIYEEKGLYNLLSETKGDDQLQRFCFAYVKSRFSHDALI